MRFSDRHSSGDELLPKVLFYSVLIHYAFLYLFFGNPFLILNRDDGSEKQTQSFDIQLLNVPMNNGDVNKALATRPLKSDDVKESDKAATPITHTTERRQSVDLEEAVKIQSLVSEAEEPDKNNKTLKPPQLAPGKKAALKMPPNMTGPEDCMLKLVGMVCPQGKVGCITAYRAFCASLPKR